MDLLIQCKRERSGKFVLDVYGILRWRRGFLGLDLDIWTLLCSGISAYLYECPFLARCPCCDISSLSVYLSPWSWLSYDN
jgi:hypothetical protein